MAFGLGDLLKKAGQILDDAKDAVADQIENISDAAESTARDLGNSDLVTQAKAKLEEVKDAAADKVEELKNSDILADAKAKMAEVQNAASEKMDELTNSDMLADAKAKFAEASDAVSDHIDAAKATVEAKIKDLTADDDKSKPA